MSEDHTPYEHPTTIPPRPALSPEDRERLRAEAARQLAEARADAIARPPRFLAAWKRGVKLAGAQYFHVRAISVEAATDKNELKPNRQAIQDAIDEISRGQGAFLAAMYSFYNCNDGQELLIQAGYPNICDLAAKLDKDHAEIISELFLSYAGW
jgi:hypothetical protein